MHDPTEAIALITASISPVEAETVAIEHAAGRVLANALRADRDSPPVSVSAMDGYALRHGDLARESMPVVGEAAIGRKPEPLATDTATRIFTGGPVPAGADTVIKREDTIESPNSIAFTAEAKRQLCGANIRVAGENIRHNDRVVEAGTLVTPPVAAACAAFGVAEPTVYRRVRIAIIATGDELAGPADPVDPWHIRDSSTTTLVAMLQSQRTAIVSVSRVADDPAMLLQHARAAIDAADLVIFTGGVSMGDHDHVPAVVREAGATTLFHKIAHRPGKPALAASANGNTLVLGLPGNPVSVLVTARLLAVAAIRRFSGLATEIRPFMHLENPDEKTIGLGWHRPVQVIAPGAVRLVENRGSGDFASVARSDGMIHLPAGAVATRGPWPYSAWY